MGGMTVTTRTAFWNRGAEKTGFCRVEVTSVRGRGLTIGIAFWLTVLTELQRLLVPTNVSCQDGSPDPDHGIKLFLTVQ